MEYRPLDITVVSAENLKDVNLMSKMDVYVVVSIADDPVTKRKTHVDKDGGRCPKWNHRLKFAIDEAALARNPNLSLLFKIRSERPLGDRDIGDVSVPINELRDKAGGDGGGSERVVEYQVRTKSGKPKGTLKFSYKFGEKWATPIEAKLKTYEEPKAAHPVAAGASTAYPVPPPQVGYAPPPHVGYAPPPPGMGVPYAPQPGYGYPLPPQPGYGGGYPPAPAYGYQPAPPPMGYGYPPVAVQQQQKPKKKKGNFGLGLGAGLLGGLLVGDMISDVGDMGAYDAGYDAGFDDSGFGF